MFAMNPEYVNFFPFGPSDCMEFPFCVRHLAMFLYEDVITVEFL